jgi:hypothetical protein
MPTYLESRPVVIADTECYCDYWSIGFKSPDTGRAVVYEYFDGCPLDKKRIASVFRRYTVITFNGQKYDLPMILYAMSGATNAELKDASDDLILYGTPHWVFMERHGLSVPDFIDHIDLMPVSPGAPQMPSLKIYAGRLHSRKMQELPIEPSASIGPVERQVLCAYHVNDLDVTIDLRNDLKAQLELRTLMSAEYGVDLRSKSDAQIAEAVIKSEIERLTGTRLFKPEIRSGSFQYKIPSFIEFQTPALQALLNEIRTAQFGIDHVGNVHMPDLLKDHKVHIGESVYRMGIGGLHSSETRVSHYSDDEFVLLDRDVTSYYPMIKIVLGLFPKQIGSAYLKVYKSIFDRRIAAKRAGNKNVAETLKIVLNGAFGKLGSPFSVLYAPDLMIQVTLTGQLVILMLIEQMELRGMHVVSANTDGFVTKVPRALRWQFNATCFDWELQTGFNLEETEYRSLHSRDVNNYISIAVEKGKPKVKVKGAFASSGPGLPGAAGQKKNPNMDICTDAVVAYLKDGTPIEDTIEWCTDPRRFLVVRRVTGGAMKDDEKIGKALRWYYSKDVQGGFVYAKNGNAVPESIGARLMMELTDRVPADLDFDYYIRESYAILQDLGVEVIDPKLRGRTGRIMARLPDAKNVHYVEASTGVALCGKTRDSIRDSWVEYREVPDGHRLCSKCRKATEL